MAIDKASQDFLVQMASQGGKPLHELTPEEARTFSETLSQLSGEGPQVEDISSATIPVTGGEIEVITIKPVDNPAGVIVYYHGGGWVIGKASGFLTLGKNLAIQSNCAVVLVDYRKAPESRYPVAVDDAYAALEWVDAHIEHIAGQRVPLIVSGDSAGGNLSAVMAIRARDRKGPAISFQALIYPVTADNLDNSTYTDPENQLLLSRDSMVWFWDHYAPDTAQRKETDASPLYTKDLSGLPPAVVITAGHDPLREEGEAYAARLIQAGVTTIFKRFEDQFHGFFTMVNILPGSEKSIAFISKAIKNHISSGNHS